MPFYIVPTEDTVVDVSITDPADPAYRQAYSTRAAAHAAAHGAIVVYVEDGHERWAWRIREADRFDAGLYQRVPWADCDCYPSHFVHISKDNPTMIAYTPNAEYGHTDRQIRTKPGRYLEQFYADVPLETRQTWIKLSTFVPEALAIATTADDIETVYRNADAVRSCMGPDSHSGCDVGRHGAIHPVRVYGASDLALAYLGPKENATARAIIWPAKMRYIRVYGAHRLTCLLEQAGYVEGDAHGARIRRIEAENGGLIMPYVDGAAAATDIGEGWLQLGARGPIDCRVTNGTTGGETYTCTECGEEVTEEDSLCPSCEESRCVCGRCEDVFFDSNCPTYCQSCEDSRSYCNCCHSDTWGPMHWAESRQEDVCENCAHMHADSRFTCESCGEQCHEWVDFDRDEQSERITTGAALTVCAECATLSVCPACGHRWEAVTVGEACPSADCGDAVAHCPDTLPLPLPDLTEDLPHA